MTDRTSTAGSQSGATPHAGVAIFGLGNAAMITTFFGFVWLGWGLSAVPGFPVPGWISLYLAAIALGTLAVRLIRRGKSSMDASGVDRKKFWARRAGRFRLITMLEGAGCIAVVVLSNVFHRVDLIPAGISIVVGLHFLPLANLLGFPVYLGTGIAILLCDGVSLWRFKSAAITASVGACTGTVLWITAILALLRARRFSRG